ncbi:helix-turn-helix transcriptional regulator [Raoultibacter phocaeensis]|uniref:helix-turn-helix transcriptional regulator n=1 Tax=Raoultibacter phocaeensis TaxID=2479841 RepID=UPI0015D57152|nr:LuxR C-terminal-related transcriptional regulator [Raoultibacter phocaeensis]
MLRAFSLELTDARVNEMGRLYLLGGVLGLTALAAYLFLPLGKMERRRITLPLVRNVLIVMAVAFLLAPFLSGVSLSVSYGIFGAGFWCFRAISWILCLLIVVRFRYSPVRAIGVMDGAFALSVVVSAQLNSWLVETIKVGGTELTTVSLITVFVLMFIVVVVLNGKETGSVLRETVEDRGSPDTGMPSRGDGDIASCIDEITQEYDLTPREAEVALLLAKGRSLPFIQNELYISSGTAQTHARHIYKKLDIHSRQEFLDIVEARIAPNRESLR